MRDENQLHAAIVEIIAEERAEVKYSTVQNWYAGDREGRGGVYNFVTKRGLCRGDHSKISWTRWRPDRRSHGNIMLRAGQGRHRGANSTRWP